MLQNADELQISMGKSEINKLHIEKWVIQIDIEQITINQLFSKVYSTIKYAIATSQQQH